MRTLSILYILFIFVGCSKNKETDINYILAQNNYDFIISLEEYQLKLQADKGDRPNHFDHKFYEFFNVTFQNIKKLNSKITYDTTFENIRNRGYENKIGETIKPIESENIVILKNNLLLNLNKIVHSQKEKDYLIAASRCSFGPIFKITKQNVNDTMVVDVYTRINNNFQINIDWDESSMTPDYLVERDYKVATIKKSLKKSNSNIKGKIFYRDDNIDYIFMEEFDTKSATSDKFPY